MLKPRICSTRSCAGQAIVQVVEEMGSRNEYAIKFFMSKSAFEQEQDLYTDTSLPLGQFLPQLHSIVLENSGLIDAHGRSLPSCIVMEKGEALDVWIMESGHLDLVGGLQV